MLRQVAGVLAVATVLVCAAIQEISSTGPQEQGYLFAYSYGPLITPTIPSCPTPWLITSISTTNAPGPAPASPHTMVVMAHEQIINASGQTNDRMYTVSLPLGQMSVTQEIANPWAPGTQFIACVWSSNGVSGGCQDLTTVVPSANETQAAYENDTSQCRLPDVAGKWVTPLEKTLDVSVEGSNGLIAQNGWPESCSELMITPKNGTAPFTTVIAPAASPPTNITSSTMGSVNWTVALTHGQAFMLAVFDSAGNSWAYGPLHAGAGTDQTCFSVPVSDGGGLPIGAVVGGTIGGLAVGIAMTGLATYLISKSRTARRLNEAEQQAMVPEPFYPLKPKTTRQSSAVSSFRPGSTSETQIEGTQSLGYGAGPFDTPSTLYSLSSPQSTKSTRLRGSSLSQGVNMGNPYEHLAPAPEPNSAADPGRRTDSWNSSLSTERRHPSRQLEQQPAARDADGDSLGGRERRGQSGRNIYVVHSDAPGGDWHIQLPDARANVVELPPSYRPDPRALGRPSVAKALPAGVATPSTPTSVRTRTASPGAGSESGATVDLDHLIFPYLQQLEDSRSLGSRNSGMSADSRRSLTGEIRGLGFGLTDEEIRARVEAAMAEKEREALRSQTQ